MLKKILELSLTESEYYNYMLVDHSIMKAEASIKNLKDWIGDVKDTELKDRIKRIVGMIEGNIADIKKENKKSHA